MGQAVRPAIIVALLAAVGIATGLTVSAQSQSNASSQIPAGAVSIATSSTPSGVLISTANGQQIGARTIAKGIAARALAANLFSQQTDSSPAGAGSQEAPLLLTSQSESNRIKKISRGFYFTFAGTGAAGSLGDGGAASSAEFDLKADSLVERSGLAIAGDGTVFVADSGNSTIRRIAPSTSSEPEVVRSIAGRWAPAQSVALSEPLGLAVDRGGDLFIADLAANAVLELPNATSEAPGDLQILAQVASPSNIAVTQDGSKVFVSTTVTGAIFAIDAIKKTVATEAGLVGRANACGTSATGASAASVCPAALAVDHRGNLFISDANSNRVLRVNAADGKVVTIATGFRSPGGIAVDSRGNLYVADQGRSQLVFIPADGGQSCVTGQSQILEICPASNDFGTVVQGGITSTVPFVLTNTGQTSVQNLVFSPSLPSTNPPIQPPSSPFIIQTTSCVTTIGPADSCTLNVTFSPNTTGDINGTLMVSDSNQSDTVSSALTGSGTNFQLQLASGQDQSITVTAGTTAVYNFTLIPDANNPYAGPVTIVCPPPHNPSQTASPINGLPTLAYCVAPTSPVMITPGQNTNFSVSIETTSRAGVTSNARLLPVGPGIWPRSPWSHSSNLHGRQEIFAFAAALFFIAFLTINYASFAEPFPRRWAFRSVLAIFLLSAIGLTLGGCGGHKLTIDGTPSGTANLVFQATAQGTGRSLTVQLIVQ